MRKLSLQLALLVTAMLAMPLVSAAQVKYIQITVKSAKLWPVKPDGRCWDPPCFGKKYELPARGAADYQKYFEDKNFQMLCNPKSPVAPDAFVDIQIGKYGRFTTDKINNNCTPEWNVSHTFRVGPNDPFTVKVLDNDGGAGIQVKTDEMGIFTAPSVPKELLEGKTFTIKSFGQVEELVLEGKVVERPAIDATKCEGVYNVRIVEYEVKDKKASGKSWDLGFGRTKLPDVIVKLKIGDNVIETPKQQDTVTATFTNIQRVIPLKPGMQVTLEVTDKDPGSAEMIGQTAAPDVCKLLTPNGRYTFENFGQVVRVVLIFERQQ
jgi:hypothetical protein